MAETVPPEFDRFISRKQAAGDRHRPERPLAAGDTEQPIFANAVEAAELIGAAAKRAVGLYRPSRRTEAVWVKGESQLVVGLTGFEVTTGDGLLTVVVPVRCDQTGRARVSVTFVTGTDKHPAGVYAATHRRPQGPAMIIETWGENLVAYAWQCLLGLVAGVAGAVGKDNRGNILVPAEMTVNADGITVVPMARHRFAGSTGLTTTIRPRT
ncbi:hypothetical protein SRABI26_00388 [Arthrobacter sp. Bi26]|uniref:hypothetical protein n=1 Tax=Arthrobacter sp. Bi26 TaxID=2822350 RepID=UPI001DE31BE5|nr:hypothetical protein [Arthrobacter sp. Bi26]CAH0137422.1 hypothetical protein SRABI26_00388 [Arthrobacter sp. Bi26]